MTLQQLKCVCAVADHNLSVSRAAEILHMTQPGVSKMIRALEKEIAVEIFVRRGNRLAAVTDAGHEALALARRIMHDRGSLQDLAKRTQSDKSGTLRIGTTPIHARYALLDAVRRFAKRYPGVDLDIVQGRPAEILNAVAAGEVDLGISTLPDRVPPRVVTLDAYPIEYCLIVPPRHPLLAKRRVTIEDVARHPIITYNESFNSGFVVRREFQRRGLAPRIVMKAADANVVKAYVASGLGIAVLLEMAVEPARDRDLRVIASDHIFPRSIAKMSLRRDQPLRAFVYDFIGLVSPRWNVDAVRDAMQA